MAEARSNKHILNKTTLASQTKSGSGARTTQRERRRPPKDMVVTYAVDLIAIPRAHT